MFLGGLFLASNLKLVLVKRHRSCGVSSRGNSSAGGLSGWVMDECEEKHFSYDCYVLVSEDFNTQKLDAVASSGEHLLRGSLSWCVCVSECTCTER